jgi:hypothetical protein
MDRQTFEQSCAIKFCVKLGESATVAYEKLQRAYGEHSLSRAQVFNSTIMETLNFAILLMIHVLHERKWNWPHSEHKLVIFSTNEQTYSRYS